MTQLGNEPAKPALQPNAPTNGNHQPTPYVLYCLTLNDPAQNDFLLNSAQGDNSETFRNQYDLECISD